MAKKRKDFWNKEYAKARSFALSDEPSEDLKKFTRFLTRLKGKELLNVTRKALDVGCGNGRNLIYLSQEFGMHGLGYDLSQEAIESAKQNAEALPLEFLVQSLDQPIPLEDSSVTIALDMMASHVLKQKDRETLRSELYRVLKPGGWLLFKTFLLEEDKNAHELLREHPGPEEGMYLHPKIKIAEYVWPNLETIEAFFEPYFTIHKAEKSFKHVTRHGKPWKRRSITVYLEKS